jgi:signal transduction histidine kinase
MPPEWPRVVAVLDTQVQRLSSIVEKLLDFKALSTRDLEAEVAPTCLATAVETASQQLRAGHPERALELTADLAPDASHADAGADDVTFVLQSLLENAVKFGDKEPVQIRVAAAPEKPGWVRVSVTDNGRGIPHEYFDRVFEGFVQVEDHVTGQVPGLGVGLYMARQVVQAYGGAMSVQSRLDEGSTFSFTLPAAKCADA